jgi:hypothetical protein
MYRFTHRSFQEYFAAVFVTRGPAIDLGALLDNLAARRSDVVIPMAIDMNRNLIEKEWVLPGVRSITSMVPDTPFKTLAFAEHVFGNISYDGTRRNDQLMVGAPPSPVLTRLAYFKDLYPKIITKLEGLIGLSHDDREKMRLPLAATVRAVVGKQSRKAESR